MNNKKISLQEPQSSGGEIAEKGFEFQNNAIISFIPRWLNDSSFDSFIREAMGDFEVKFFRPCKKNQYIFDFIEVKDHNVTPAEFWGEIDRFIEMDRESNGMYRYFILASTGVSSSLSPITNSLRRVRGPYSFYGAEAEVIKNSLEEFEKLVERAGHKKEEAKFLFNKVIIKDDFGAILSQGQALFTEALSGYFPSYDSLSHGEKTVIFSSLKSFVGAKRNIPMTRKEIEDNIRGSIGPEKRPSFIEPTIFTSIDDSEEKNAINLEWSEFWGGNERRYPMSEAWNSRMISQLKETKLWISERHNSRRIKISGNRRLSTTFAIGSELSATSGFVIDFNFRDEIWSTDKHATVDTPDYNLQNSNNISNGEDVVVSVGIIHNIEQEVNLYLKSNSLIIDPQLHIFGDKPIVSSEQANRVVQDIKKMINNFTVKSGAKKIHLFFAGPSFLALFLGHRLNATADVQLYERIAPNNYQQTCLLKCR